ncbi:hypothetical protein PTKIN_Ptkin03bG0233500 [Pterospermum kingtungense]
MTPFLVWFQSDQGSSCFTKTCATIGSLIIVLLTLLQVKYGNKDASPFETHRLIMTLFIVAMLTYALTAVAAIKFQAWFTNHSLNPLLNQPLRLLPATVTPDSDFASSPMAQISMVQQDGSIEIIENRNERNV